MHLQRFAQSTIDTTPLGNQPADDLSFAASLAGSTSQDNLSTAGDGDTSLVGAGPVVGATRLASDDGAGALVASNKVQNVEPNVLKLRGLEGLAVWGGIGLSAKDHPLFKALPGVEGVTAYLVLIPGLLPKLPEGVDPTSPFISFKLKPGYRDAIAAYKLARGLLGDGPRAEAAQGLVVGALPRLDDWAKANDKSFGFAPLISISTIDTKSVLDIVSGNLPKDADGFPIMPPASFGIGGVMSFNTGKSPIGDGHGLFVSASQVPGTKSWNLTFGMFATDSNPPTLIGGSIGVTAKRSTDLPGAPWMVEWQGKKVPLPAELTGFMNAATGENAPIVEGVSLSGMLKGFGITPEHLATATNVAKILVPTVMEGLELGSVVSAYKSPPMGILATVGYVLRKGEQIDEATTHELAKQFIAQGGLSPSKLAAQLPAEMSTAELIVVARLLKSAINLHLEENPGDREKLETNWRLAANGKDTRLAFPGKAVRGDLLGALDVAISRGDPIAHYGGGISVLWGLTSKLAPDERIEGFAGGRTPQGDFAQVAVGILPEKGIFAVLSPPGRNLPPKELMSLSLDDAKEEARKLVTSDKIDTNYLQAVPGKPPLGTPVSEPVASIPVDQSQLISQGYAGAINLSTGTSHQALVSQNVQDGKFYWTDKNGKAHEIEPAAGKPAITTRQEAMDRVREMIKFGAISPANLLPLDNPSPGPGPGLRFTP